MAIAMIAARDALLRTKMRTSHVRMTVRIDVPIAWIAMKRMIPALNGVEMVMILSSVGTSVVGVQLKMIHVMKTIAKNIVENVQSVGNYSE